MKQTHLVICIFTMIIQGRSILVSTNEGTFLDIQDANRRIAEMIEEESKNDEEMFFEIKTVYTKN